jgi:surface protein
MFFECKNLKSLDLSKWDVKNGGYFDSMFRSSGLESINLSGWSMNEAGTFVNAFSDCVTLTELNLSNCNLLVLYAYQTFKNCSSLHTLDLSGFDISAAMAVQEMFAGMTKLKKITISEKFSFNGCGTLMTEYPNPAILPTPDSSLIKGADGYWYNAETATAYTPENIPNNIAVTYLAVPGELTCATLIKYGTLVQMADAIRSINGSSVKYTPAEMITAITEFILMSSTEDSTKRFKLTVDDDGVLTTTEIVDDAI